jgi:hypothetical protein
MSNQQYNQNQQMNNMDGQQQYQNQFMGNNQQMQ